MRKHTQSEAHKHLLINCTINYNKLNGTGLANTNKSVHTTDTTVCIQRVHKPSLTMHNLRTELISSVQNAPMITTLDYELL